MSAANPYARSAVLAGATVRRLRREGRSLDEAKRLVVQVVNSEEAEMTRLQRPFDEAGVAERLKRLAAGAEE